MDNQIALSKLETKKILLFIAMNLRTGQNVPRSLMHYSDKMTKKEDVKIFLAQIAENLNKGKKLEKVLYDFRLITEFQYSILLASVDKTTAFKEIIDSEKDSGDVNRFYGKNIVVTTSILIFVLLVIPVVCELFGAVLFNVIKYDDSRTVNSFVSFVLDNYQYCSYIMYTLITLVILLVVFYKHTYDTDLSLHYKIFRYRAFKDTEVYLTLANNILKTKANAYQTMELLGTYMYPESSRQFFLDIKDDISSKNIDGIENTLRSLYFNEYAIFSIVSAFTIGNSKNITRGFSDALDNTREYTEEFGETYKAILSTTCFVINLLSLGFLVLFIVLLETDIAL